MKYIRPNCFALKKDREGNFFCNALNKHDCKECKFYRSRDQEEYRRRKYGYQEPKAERKLQEIKKSGL